MLKKNKEKEIRKERRLFIGRPARFEKKTSYNRKKLPKPLDTDRGKWYNKYTEREVMTNGYLGRFSERILWLFL